MYLYVFSALSILFVLTGCHPADAPDSPLASLPDAHLVEQDELAKRALDLSHIVVVRLLSEGKRLEVSSLLPVVIAQTEVSGQAYKTIFSINKSGDTLVLFSRDFEKKSSYKTVIKFDVLERKEEFVFPVVQADGSLKEVSFKLSKIIKPQQ